MSWIQIYRGCGGWDNFSLEWTWDGDRAKRLFSPGSKAIQNTDSGDFKVKYCTIYFGKGIVGQVERYGDCGEGTRLRS